MHFPSELELRYDRSVTPEFAALFLPGGVAASLLEYAHARYPIDFQFRKDPKTKRQWATVYVGMAAVLNVEDKGTNGFLLNTHVKYQQKALGWNDDWKTAQSPTAWAAHWHAVEDYLERNIVAIIEDGRFTKKEGVVQAAVSLYLGDGTRAVLDREVAPSFRDTPTRDLIRQQYSDPLAAAVSAAGVPGKPPTRFGMECDALAIDQAGHLLAIEVKPGSVGSLAWVPAQATMYARVLQHWVDNDKDWRDIITASFNQRKSLGLVPQTFTLPTLQQKVRPAVAFQRIASSVHLDRMRTVQKTLLAQRVGDPDLTFYEVSLSGRLDVHKVP